MATAGGPRGLLLRGLQPPKSWTSSRWEPSTARVPTHCRAARGTLQPCILATVPFGGSGL